jgi:hypothetical protein
LVSLGPARNIASSELDGASTSALMFSTGWSYPFGRIGECLTASDDGLVLTECDGGSAQNFLLIDYHFIVHGGNCLEGNSTWAGFVACDQENPSQWFQLAPRGYGGPIANCWCHPGPDQCPMPCNTGVSTGPSGDSMVIGGLMTFYTINPSSASADWDWSSHYATSAASYVRSPSTMVPWGQCGHTVASCEAANAFTWISCLQTASNACDAAVDCVAFTVGDVGASYYLYILYSDGACVSSTKYSDAGAGPAPADWYLYEKALTPAPPTPPSQSPTAPTPTPAPDCAGQWQKCGWDGWAGPTCCAEGLQCEAVNQSHSQCSEAGRRLAAEVAVASPVLV